MSFISKIIVFFFLLGSLALGCICYVVHAKCIDLSSLQQKSLGQASILLDEQGREWGRFQLDKREFVPIEHMPEHLIQAFLVVEDRNFFNHAGISLRGIVRSVLVNIYHGHKVQGASTITQQLVRLLFFNAKKTFSRKIKEQVYALLIERQCSKEQILELYLNNVYFGYGIYGVQAAAQRFWGKDIAAISVDQSALLAAIMKSPLYYCPIHAPKAAAGRRNLILKTMQELGFISSDCCSLALQKPVIIADVESGTVAPHLKETIRIFLENLVGKEKLYAGGLKIQTTINLDTQLHCQKIFKERVAALKTTIHPEIDGGLVAMDVATGQIRAMIGGYDFKLSKYNRALQARRQIGSVFKPFVYAAALEQGAQFYDVEVDEPFEMVQGSSVWAPENNTHTYLGPITRACALSLSNNIVAIKTLLQAGIPYVISLAQRCHITSYLPPYPSLALGCVDVTLSEALGAFNIFANNGVYVEPHFISWVKNSVGEKIYKASIVKEQVLDAGICGQIVRVLSFSMDRLRKIMGDKWFGAQAFGKTGTTNDSRTCWFCGSTPDVTIAMYLGCDENQSLGDKVYPSRTAFPIWFDIQASLAKKRTTFYLDPKLQEVYVNWKTGKRSCDIQNPDVVPLLIVE